MAKQTVTFVSKYTELELVRQPAVDVPLPSGQAGWISQSPGLRYKFEPSLDEAGGLVGKLDVIAGQDRLVDSSGWLARDAEQGVERDAVAALRAHREFGRDFWAMPVPMTVARARIRQAIANLNEADLVALLAEEKAEHNRRELVTETQDALSLVREQLANFQAAQEAAEAARNVPWSEDDTNASLQKACDARGLTVTGTGANGAVVKSDLVKALREAQEPVPA